MTASQHLGNYDMTERPDLPEGAGAEIPAAEAPAGGLPVEPAESALERVTAERDELKDKYLRGVAEFDNFRKRTQKERAELYDRARAELIGGLLDELDDLDRLVQSGDKSPSVAELHQAIVLTDKKFWKELEKAGLETLEPLGVPFDPTVHEAISQIPAPSAEQAHTVAMVFQAGYRFKGILLRPARVQVYGEQA